jgi:RNA polymerase sigma factor (sigma-70 family)
MNWSEERQQLFNDVYTETFPILIRIAFRITTDMEVAEELCHDAYIKLYERLDQLPDQNQAKYWLIRVVKNMALNQAKRKGRERKAYERVLYEPKRKVETGEDLILKEEAYHAVQRALNQIPEKFRAVLVLKEYGELSYREIGKILNISEANVKVRAFRAREKMAELLDREGIHVP